MAIRGGMAWAVASAQRHNLRRLSGQLAIAFILVLNAAQSQALTLAWDPNPEPDIAGYKIFYGELNLPPTVLNAGNSTSITVNNLVAGKSYYFYATAYNSAGLESNPSQTITYTVPQSQAVMDLFWDASSSTNTVTYQILYRDYYATTNWTVVFPQSTSYHFSDLKANTFYLFWVKALTQDGKDADLYRLLGPSLPPGYSSRKPPKVASAYRMYNAAQGGDWVGKYGNESFWVASAPSATSPYLGPMANGTYWVWQQDSSDPAALETPDEIRRVAATWFSDTGLSIPMRFNDEEVHRVTVFCVDYERLGIQQYVEFVDDRTGSVNDSILIGSFSMRGIYTIFDVKGLTTLRIRPRTGPYVTVSGIFID